VGSPGRLDRTRKGTRRDATLVTGTFGKVREFQSRRDRYSGVSRLPGAYTRNRRRRQSLAIRVTARRPDQAVLVAQSAELRETR